MAVTRASAEVSAYEAAMRAAHRTAFPRSVPGARERRLHDPIPPMPAVLITTTPMFLAGLCGALLGLAADKAGEFIHQLLRRRP